MPWPSRKHLVAALAAAAATGLPYAIGILKNGLLEPLLLAPVLWFVCADKTRERAGHVLLVLVSLCVTLTACDLLLRPFMGAQLHFSPMNRHQHRLPLLPMLGRWDPGVDFVGDVYGDLAAMAGEPAYRETHVMEFRTDRVGFRNETVPTQIDTLVLGDSFAAGVGVTQRGTFAALLAAQDRRSVYNLSYPGGPYEQWLNFSIEAPALPLASDTLLIWTLYTGNDFDDNGGETWDLAALPWRTGLSAKLVTYRTFRNRSPLRQWWEALQSRWSGSADQVMVRRLPDGRPMLFYRPHEAWGTRTQAEVAAHPNYLKLRRTLQAMKEATAKRGVQPAIVVLPTKGQVYRSILEPSEQASSPASGFAAAVLAACREVALQCLDSRPFLMAEAERLYAASQDLLWWRDDTHLNGHGHTAVAALVEREILTPYLSEHLAVAAR